MGTLNLQRFCSSDEDRPSLHHPWIWKGHEYATDARIIVRVVTELPSWLDAQFPAPAQGAVEIFKQSIPAQLERLSLPENLPTFELVKKPCGDCEDLKDLWEGGPESLAKMLQKCEGCLGFGYTFAWPPRKLGDGVYSAGALLLLSQWPGCEVYQGLRPEGNEESGRLYFRFEGGEGVLLGLKDGSSEADECSTEWPWPETFGLVATSEGHALAGAGTDGALGTTTEETENTEGRDV